MNGREEANLFCLGEAFGLANDAAGPTVIFGIGFSRLF
jgi:hypothetical protein